MRTAATSVAARSGPSTAVDWETGTTLGPRWALVHRGAVHGFWTWIVVALLMGAYEAFMLELSAGPPAAGALLAEVARHSWILLVTLAPIFVGVLAVSASMPGASVRRILGLVAATLLSCAAAALIFHHPGDGDPHVLRTFLYNWVALWVTAGFVVAIHEVYRSEVFADERARTLRVQEARLEAELSRSRLQLLQIQIEPHFLFNTLAHVELLCRSDPAAAERMLDAVIEYLESSLPALRSSRSILSRERELLAAYLEIHRIRLGTRLSYEIRLPPELEGAEVPAMMLLTLVENAIKHGINPLPQGGRIVVQAERRAGSLEITVTDSGQGLSEGHGGGVGLANLRARLVTEFGSSARFDLRSSAALGTCALLSLPLSVRAAPWSAR